MTKTYILKFLLYLDQLAEAAIWRDSGLTISARCGLALRQQGGSRILKTLGRFLNWLQKDHCEGAILGDIGRARKAIEILGGTVRNW